MLSPSTHSRGGFTGLEVPIEAPPRPRRRDPVKDICPTTGCGAINASSSARPAPHTRNPHWRHAPRRRLAPHPTPSPSPPDAAAAAAFGTGVCCIDFSYPYFTSAWALLSMARGAPRPPAAGAQPPARPLTDPPTRTRRAGWTRSSS